MSEKFQNKYRIASARLQSWDYRWAGSYFITICTKNREHFFGEVINGKMQLSTIGVIADILWFEIKNHAKNLELGEFVVMPNHIHGVLILNNNNEIVNNDNNNANNVETGHALSLHTTKQNTENPTEKSIKTPSYQTDFKISVKILYHPSSVDTNRLSANMLTDWVMNSGGKPDSTTISLKMKNLFISFPNTLLTTHQNGRQINFTIKHK